MLPLSLTHISSTFTLHAVRQVDGGYTCPSFSDVGLQKWTCPLCLAHPESDAILEKTTEELKLLIWTMWQDYDEKGSLFSKSDVADAIQRVGASAGQLRCAKLEIIEMLTCNAKRAADNVQDVVNLVEAITNAVPYGTALYKGAGMEGMKALR